MIVGTAGHVDHGKTALVRALTGTETDRLPEEKRRGITIDLGFAYWRTGASTTIGFVDVPGHERFVGTMVAGATGIDCLLLVVAADDGVMPQTREHLAIADLLGLRHGLVVLEQGRSRGCRSSHRGRGRDQGRARGDRACRSPPPARLDRYGRRSRRPAGMARGRGRTSSVPRSRWALPTRDRPQLRPFRRRHGGDRHRSVGCRGDRRPGDAQSRRHAGAGPLDPCSEPSGRARRGGPTLRPQPRRHRARGGIARRHGARSLPCTRRPSAST